MINGVTGFEESRHERRRRRDRFLEFIRVFWPVLVGFLVLVTQWAEVRVRMGDLDKRVGSIEVKDEQVVTNTTEIAVIKANMASIKENVEDVKHNTDRIIARLERMSR